MRTAIYTIFEDGTKRQTTSPEAAQEASIDGATVTATFNEF